MKYFKDVTGTVYAYEVDGSQDEWIKPDLVLMTPAEVDAHHNPPQTREQLLQVFAARRYQAEVSGITIDGLSVYTDRTTQNKLTAASNRAQRNAEYTVNWKLTSGAFINLNATTIIAIGDTVGDHVQACYDREGELAAAVEDGTYTEAMLNTGWPV